MLVLGSKILAYLTGGGSPPVEQAKVLGFATANRTTSGAFTLEDADLGATPTVAFLIGGKTGVGASLGMGFYDGTNAYSIYGRSRDNVTPTNARAILSNTKVYQSLGRTANTAESAITPTSFSENTFDLSFDSTPEVATDLFAVLMNLEEVDVSYYEFTGATTVLTKTGLTFEPNFFIAFTLPHNIVGTGVASNNYLNIGLAQSVAVQHSLNYGEVNNVAATDLTMRVATDALSYAIATGQTIKLTAVTSDGYSITRSTSAGSSTICILAANIPNDVSLSIEDTPITTGNHVLDLGLETNSHLFLLSNVEAVDTSVSDDTANGLSIGMLNSLLTYCYGFISDDNANPSDSETYISTSAIALRSAVGTTALQFTLESITEDGPELNWATVTGTAKKMIVLGIVETEGSSGLMRGFNFSDEENSQSLLLIE